MSRRSTGWSRRGRQLHLARGGGSSYWSPRRHCSRPSGPRTTITYLVRVPGQAAHYLSSLRCWRRRRRFAGRKLGPPVRPPARRPSSFRRRPGCDDVDVFEAPVVAVRVLGEPRPGDAINKVYCRLGRGCCSCSCSCGRPRPLLLVVVVVVGPLPLGGRQSRPSKWAPPS